MRITELAKHSKLNRDRIRYLVLKGYIEPDTIKIKNRVVSDFPENEVKKTEYMAKYVEQGYKYDVAYEKAIKDMQNPQLELVGDEDK